MNIYWKIKKLIQKHKKENYILRTSIDNVTLYSNGAGYQNVLHY